MFPSTRSARASPSSSSGYASATRFSASAALTWVSSGRAELAIARVSHAGNDASVMAFVVVYGIGSDLSAASSTPSRLLSPAGPCGRISPKPPASQRWSEPARYRPALGHLGAVHMSKIWLMRSALAVVALGFGVLASTRSSAHDEWADDWNHQQIHRDLHDQHDAGHDWLGREHRAEHEYLEDE